MFFNKKVKVVYSSNKGRVIYKNGEYIPQVRGWFGWDGISEYDYFKGYLGEHKFDNLADAKHFLIYRYVI